MASFFRSELDSLIAFAKKPRDAQELTTFSYRIKVLGFAFLLNVGMILIASVGLGILEHFKVFDSSNHQVELFLKQYHPAVVFVLAAFLLPILEELIFRFGLRYNKFLPGIIWRFIKPTPKDISQEQAESLNRLGWNRAFPVIFYSSTVVFAFIHIFNFELSGWTYIFTPILVLPQFITGFLCAYLRVKLNFAYSMLLHIFNNTLFIGITFAMMWANGNFNINQTTKSEVIDNVNYYLKIEVIENVYDNHSVTKVDYQLEDDSSNAPMDKYYNVYAKNITPIQVEDIKSEHINSLATRVNTYEDLSDFTSKSYSNTNKRKDYNNSTKRFNIHYYSKKSGMRNRDTLFMHFERITGERLK